MFCCSSTTMLITLTFCLMSRIRRWQRRWKLSRRFTWLAYIVKFRCHNAEYQGYMLVISFVWYVRSADLSSTIFHILSIIPAALPMCFPISIWSNRLMLMVEARYVKLSMISSITPSLLIFDYGDEETSWPIAFFMLILTSNSSQACLNWLNSF